MFVQDYTTISWLVFNPSLYSHHYKSACHSQSICLHEVTQIIKLGLNFNDMVLDSPDIERFRISSHLLIAASHRKASFLCQRGPGQEVRACHLLSQIYFNHQIENSELHRLLAQQGLGTLTVFQQLHFQLTSNFLQRLGFIGKLRKV